MKQSKIGITHYPFSRLSVYDMIHAKEKEFTFVISVVHVRKRIFLCIDSVHERQNDKKWLYERQISSSLNYLFMNIKNWS